MPKKLTFAAFVPMRHHSERVPGKNYRKLAGKPLYYHIIEALLACPEISQVAIDTDSPVIGEGVARDFPQVTLIERPEHLRDGGIAMNEILLHDTSIIEADFYLQTHSTNPLLRPETISKAVRTLSENYPAYDSLFSVTRWQKRLWDGLARPVNHNPNILLRTQDLPPIYEENSCMYIFTRNNLEARRNRLGERPYMFIMEPSESWDIDEEVDFQVADLLLSLRMQGQKI